MESSDMNRDCAPARSLMQGQAGHGRSEGREVRHALTVAAYVDTVLPHPALPCPCGHVVGAGVCAERCGPGSGDPARRHGGRSRGERETGTRGHGHHPWTPAGMPADAPPFHRQPDAGGVCAAHGRAASRPRTGLPHGRRRLPGTDFRTSPGPRIICGILCGTMVRCARAPGTPGAAMRRSTATAVDRRAAGPPRSGTDRNRHADLTPADFSAEAVAMSLTRPWTGHHCGSPPAGSRATVPS